VAVVDNDRRKVGERVASVRVEHIDDLNRIVRRDDVAIGLICTPAAAAQEVADRMVAAGIRSILNFAPAVITVPEDVSVRKVDLSIELQILGYYEQRKAALEAVKGGRATALDLAAVP
jgi:redox-sensing transcriptional repressor